MRSKKAFDSSGVTIPFRVRTLHLGAGVVVGAGFAEGGREVGEDCGAGSDL